MREFHVCLKRSAIGQTEKTKKRLISLGLRRFGRVVRLPDTPCIRGVLYKVHHLVNVSVHEAAS